MDTLPLSQVLAGQHRQIDQGVKGVIDGNGNLAALAEALALLRPPVVSTVANPQYEGRADHLHRCRPLCGRSGGTSNRQRQGPRRLELRDGAALRTEAT